MTLNPPIKCPTCGTEMHLALVGKVNPVWVTRCPNILVEHPTTICTPTMLIPKEST